MEWNSGCGDSSQSGFKRRKNDDILDKDTVYCNCPSSLMLSTKSPHHPAADMKVIVLGKPIKGCACDVKQAKKLRSGDVLIKCKRKQQAVNLLSDDCYLDPCLCISPQQKPRGDSSRAWGFG